MSRKEHHVVLIPLDDVLQLSRSLGPPPTATTTRNNSFICNKFRN